MEKFIVTPKEDKSVTMTIRIDRALQEEYNDLAAKTNRSRNELISMALQYARLLKNYNSIPADERLTKEDIEQGTITITSTGSVYRGSHNTMSVIEVIPPQISAIGIGSISEKPGIYTDRNGEKQIGIRMFLPVLLAFDHRALDFDDLTPFFKKTR